MKFSMQRGVDIHIKGRPRQIIEAGAQVSSIALSGRDFRGVRPKMLVAPDDRIAVGQPLFCDRNDPDVLFTSPAAGVVSRIDQSRRNSFETLEIRCEGDQFAAFDTSVEVRKVLQKSGLWTTLTARPFGGIPHSKSEVHSILVTAMDTNPLAAEPSVIIRAAQSEFELGLEKLALLGGGPVVVCQPPGLPITEAQIDAIHIAEFCGKHPAGLPGTHLDCLGLGGQSVWQIGYQDVIAIGYLFLNQQLPVDRIVAVGGPMARSPRLLRTRRGANLTDLLRGEASDGGVTIFSGSVLTGRPAAFLGHLHVQLCLLPAEKRGRQRPHAEPSSMNAQTPILPSETFEGFLPQNILPVPLMRALCVGDWETAYRLGAADLLEEDVALLSTYCSSGADYGVLLRRALDDIARLPK